MSTPSGSGWRATIFGKGGAEVSIWAPTDRDADYMSAMEHMRMMERDEDTRVRLEAEFEAQQVAEFHKIKARA